MGIPQHYAVELPRRCLRLIDALMPEVAGVRMEGDEAGPLTTSFLVAMSTPIITLPIERVERHRGKEIEGFIDERHLSPETAAAVDDELGGKPLRQSALFEPGVWRQAVLPYAPGLNLVRNFPQRLVDDLNDESALSRADQMPAAQWATCLRNALSHGGVFYLNEAGHPAEGEPVHHISFVSTKLSPDRRTIESLLALRIARAQFLPFLRGWVNWLERAGLMRALAA